MCVNPCVVRVSGVLAFAFVRLDAIVFLPDFEIFLATVGLPTVVNSIRKAIFPRPLSPHAALYCQQSKSIQQADGSETRKPYLEAGTYQRTTLTLSPTPLLNGDPWENRTPVFAVRGRRLSRLTKGPYGRSFSLCHGSIFCSATPLPLFFWKRKVPAPTYFPGSSPTKYLRHNQA